VPVAGFSKDGTSVHCSYAPAVTNNTGQPAYVPLTFQYLPFAQLTS